MRKVLIIDDEPWSRQVVKALGNWEALGLGVVGEAEDGRQGMAAIEALRPQIVITDMRMPGKDGVELLRELNERYPSLLLVVMSGFDDYAYLKQAVLSRAVDYLLKPLDPEELNAALGRCAAELERREAERGAPGMLGWRTPQLFREPSGLERYIEHRKRIHALLQEMNPVALGAAFGQLEALLRRELSAADDPRRLAAIGRDFLQRLEEFASAEGIAGNALALEAEAPLSENRPANGPESMPANERHREESHLGQWGNPGEMTTELSRLYAATISSIEARRRGRGRLDLEDVRGYLDRHYLDPVTLESVAQQFLVSKEHLSRAFKAHVGETLTDYVIRKRMEKARELIGAEGISIKQAAEMTGYPELAYFYRVFKKQFGYPPGELRGAGSRE
ncbi:response regulator transcription factor [Cohnella fermenti]|nr:response regulator [Cohnella fermenti]